MFGSSGFIHRPPKHSKKELETMMRLEARSHAKTCEDLAQSMRIIGWTGTRTVDALEKAAKFLRKLTEEKQQKEPHA